MDDQTAELREEILAVQRWAEARGSEGKSYAQHLASLATMLEERDDDETATRSNQ